MAPRQRPSPPCQTRRSARRCGSSRAEDVFPVPDPTRACTQQYGGPEIAVVTGWFNGKEVDATFKRTDGCEIARWQALAPLLGALAGGTGAI
ncbi:hypothetical protein [Arthrobacter polaris]|uniref:hypothetical protein n=1 Tax=Arthrobacter polaris TaxID=2813727 RepID=UPI002AFE73A2|nr:hypothetical protein [Arthrobacter polaris]